MLSALLPPTLSETAAAAVLLSVKLPDPCNPPKVAVVSAPKLSDPPPLASKVLAEIAPALARSSVPLETSVTPV